VSNQFGTHIVLAIKGRCENMNILAIESSCDETAAAVVQDGRKVLSNIAVAFPTVFDRIYEEVVK